MKLAIGSDYRVTEAVTGIHRVEMETHDGHVIVGYVLEAGHVFVSLRGEVYNTSVEIGQSLDLDAAVRLLVH
ncbi:hypothetical protein BH11ACT3_BH11ACT3_13770 [soil metagenome]